jgi:hypothetical protein
MEKTTINNDVAVALKEIVRMEQLINRQLYGDGHMAPVRRDDEQVGILMAEADFKIEALCASLCASKDREGLEAFAELMLSLGRCELGGDAPAPKHESPDRDR